MFTVFSTYATSIFLEGLIFLLAGVLILSFIEIFVPKEFIEKLVPEIPLFRTAGGIIVSFFIGLIISLFIKDDFILKKTAIINTY